MQNPSDAGRQSGIAFETDDRLIAVAARLTSVAVELAEIARILDPPRSQA
jgi:hypothetical protein